jgi:hypothetical protein
MSTSAPPSRPKPFWSSFERLAKIDSRYEALSKFDVAEARRSNHDGGATTLLQIDSSKGQANLEQCQLYLGSKGSMMDEMMKNTDQWQRERDLQGSVVGEIMKSLDNQPSIAECQILVHTCQQTHNYNNGNISLMSAIGERYDLEPEIALMTFNDSMEAEYFNFTHGVDPRRPEVFPSDRDVLYMKGKGFKFAVQLCKHRRDPQRSLCTFLYSCWLTLSSESIANAR